ncbi:hypothetical protein [Microbaculum marinum]|uniref:Secreted protein n=1 Tax=Microbaculum marinum TaxID=1764581 RepID=A0AAW9RYC4_9HYPH
MMRLSSLSMASFFIFAANSFAFAQQEDFSFNSLRNMSSFERSLLESAIKTGQLRNVSRPSEREIYFDGISYGDRDDISLFIQLIILDVCPACSTTTSGSTVRVKYGGGSSSGRDTYAVDRSDDYYADKVEENCEELLDRHKYDRDSKDILIIEDNDDDNKIAICFHRD